MTDCVCCICGPRILHHFIILFEIASRHITLFKLINIPEAAHKNPFKCDYGIGQQRCYTMFTRPFSSGPNVKEEKVWLRETNKCAMLQCTRTPI